MTVLEVGIFHNSILILYKSFYPLDNVKDSMDYQKRSNLIHQIQKMGEYVLRRDVEYLDNQKYRIYFSVPSKFENLFIYAIDDKQSSKKIVQDLLSIIIKKFKENYPQFQTTSQILELDQFQSFSYFIEQTLSDERFTPIDRIRHLLM